MQRNINILFTLFFIALNFKSLGFENFSSTDLKSTADSLFNNKNYVDAKLIYDELYFERNLTSDDLSLKLALVNEGLKNYQWTLLFLERYLLNHPNDEKTEIKIQTLAENNKLTGYNESDINVIIDFILLYKYEITVFILLIVLIYFVLNLLKSNKYLVQGIIVGLLLIIVTIFFQKIESSEQAIIMKESLAMDEPSAASSMIEKVTPGHKITVLETVDIWTKILYNGKECYIKSANLETI